MSARIPSMKLAAALVLLSAILALAPATTAAAATPDEQHAPTTMTPSDIDWP